MAKRRARAKKSLDLGSIPIKLSMKAIKLHAKESIAILKKASWVERDKAKAIKGLTHVLATMKAVCPSMGLNVRFR